ncbi:hypothetical protein B2M27_09970 [Kluyvera intermedia]|uniref:Pyridoxamine 5'-phosphate oxidase putative domain-containing protein n=1 Tax=Kluyvera intermedia TaxID=61648 RepID=A0ABX3UGE6_KLUIN|nr:hypothetical protein [Kluyvera intermedia]ORJ50590.1 hypothetical protein B2M27_09970 [Kluyvera intermedia]
MNLATFLGKQVLGILAGYQRDNVVIHVCGVYIQSDNSLRVYFPKGHTFSAGDLVTLHLDNRSGVDEFDAEISVYRASYKGRVISQEEDWVVVVPRECQLIHGMSVVLEIREEGYQFPADDRPEQPVPFTMLRDMPEPESKDAVNKVGVLITMANEQPHTTVLAFLSSVDDDIFLITFPQMFKSRLLKRNPHCFFAMDERAHYTFERAIEWNYTIVEGEASLVPSDSPLYETIREAFIRKNPWEMGFFLQSNIEMYHIKRRQLVCSGSQGTSH